MSGVLVEFALEVKNAATAVGNVSTDEITGEFGELLRAKQRELSSALEEFSLTLTSLGERSEEHRLSEATFVSNAPTLAEIEEAEQALVSAQAVGSAVAEGAIAPVTLGLDLVHLGAAEAAQQRLSELVQQRRDAVRAFLAEQDSIRGRITSALPPVIGGVVEQSGVVPSAAAGTFPAGGAGSRSPLVDGIGSGVSRGGSGSRQSDLGGGSSFSDLGDGDAGATAAAPGVVGVPQSPVNPSAVVSRIGPQAMHGYAIPGVALPGTAISAGAPVAAMSDREFNSLLDRIKTDRGGSPSLPSSSPSTVGGGLAGGANAAPRTVQPTSWINASTSPTGVSDGQNGRTGSSPVPAANAAPQPRSAMPGMAPMMPGGMNQAQGNRDAKDQPQIMNADPDVYGDDVQTVDPIIDNQKGRFE
ncbi:hypothetical protein [Rhodococcus pyridinivorans]|uniref:hypothetical protein n=1 Tax=Rhodococcus pyridinivorans TaxID=103816 RepID=UPI00265B08E7|nr:hypothetical protein [Rhodococcus pyridinivorans]